jgi:predicted acylesterase/phospholipase RssA
MYHYSLLDFMDAVLFTGGGSRGLAHLGALEEVVAQYPNLLVDIKIVGGASVGAVMASMIVLGYAIQDIRDFYMHIRWEHFHKTSLRNLWKFWALDDGKGWRGLIEALFLHKKIPSDITFIQLKTLTGKDLCMSGVNVSRHNVEYFSPIHTPDFFVLDALLISTALPIAFPPFQKDCWYADGALGDNIPVRAVYDIQKHATILVFKLAYEDVPAGTKADINDAEDYAEHLLITLTRIGDHHVMKTYPNDPAKRIYIFINTEKYCPGFKSHSDPTIDEREALISAGVHAVRNTKEDLEYFVATIQLPGGSQPSSPDHDLEHAELHSVGRSP